MSNRAEIADVRGLYAALEGIERFVRDRDSRLRRLREAVEAAARAE
jgi:hypothetical protein